MLGGASVPWNRLSADSPLVRNGRRQEAARLPPVELEGGIFKSRMAHSSSRNGSREHKMDIANSITDLSKCVRIMGCAKNCRLEDLKTVAKELCALLERYQRDYVHRKENVVVGLIKDLNDSRVDEKNDSFILQFKNATSIKLLSAILPKLLCSHLPSLRHVLFKTQKPHSKLTYIFPLEHAIEPFDPYAPSSLSTDSVCNPITTVNPSSSELPSFIYSKVVEVVQAKANRRYVSGVTAMPLVRGFSELMVLSTVSSATIVYEKLKRDGSDFIVDKVVFHGIQDISIVFKNVVGKEEIHAVNRVRAELNGFLNTSIYATSDYNPQNLCVALLALVKVLKERKMTNSVSVNSTKTIEEIKANPQFKVENIKTIDGMLSLIPCVQFDPSASMETTQQNDKVQPNDPVYWSSSVNEAIKTSLSQQSSKNDAETRLFAESRLQSYLLNTLGELPSLLCWASLKSPSVGKCWKLIQSFKNLGVTADSLNNESVSRNRVTSSNFAFSIDILQVPSPTRYWRSSQINNFMVNYSSSLQIFNKHTFLEIRKSYSCFPMVDFQSPLSIHSDPNHFLNSMRRELEELSEMLSSLHLRLHLVLCCPLVSSSPLLSSQDAVLPDNAQIRETEWTSNEKLFADENQESHVVGIAISSPGEGHSLESSAVLSLIPLASQCVLCPSGENLWMKYQKKCQRELYDLSVRPPTNFGFEDSLLELSSLINKKEGLDGLIAVKPKEVLMSDLTSLGFVDLQSQTITKDVELAVSFAEEIWKPHLDFLTTNYNRFYRCTMCDVEFHSKSSNADNSNRKSNQGKMTSACAKAAKHFTRGDEHQKKIQDFDALLCLKWTQQLDDHASPPASRKKTPEAENRQAKENSLKFSGWADSEPEEHKNHNQIKSFSHSRW
eukprot:GDKJ01008134.1.p1 GENE.GDKJ01008134.1~~GDKJ01008134.1.p1  ORF type:complete len:893 (-),score=191.77 GDKJ01008134.1:33-2711(-)